ncbi:MAG: polyphenol oxidase family protein, partial [Casimicrobiaceae bacterium]
MTPGANSAARIAAARLDWIVPRWPAPDTIEAFVTTRNARDDTGRAMAFDPGGYALPQDPAAAAAVIADRDRLAGFLPARPCWLEQMHGAEVARFDDSRNAIHADAAKTRRSWPVPRADGAVTRTRGVVLAIRTADCLPVLLCSRTGTAVGAAHAGWRGLAAGVVENTLAALGCNADDVIAWLGPGIGQRAFEVGDEVRDAFTIRDADAAAAFIAGRAGHWYADLEALARRRLSRAGVDAVYGGG